MCVFPLHKHIIKFMQTRRGDLHKNHIYIPPHSLIVEARLGIELKLYSAEDFHYTIDQQRLLSTNK